MSWRLLLPVLSIPIAFLSLAAAASADEAERDRAPLQYNRDIRPILTENCFACHGPDSASRKAGLRLDERDAAIDFAAIVPGDPEASGMIFRTHLPEDDELAMPPADGHKRLSDEQKRLLTRWVAEGAEYEPHWSLIAPSRPELPEVSDADWPRTPIDRFLMAALDAEGLAPAPEADRRTLARRLALDLTGLPPTPEQVEAFVEDDSAEYYERYVDTLLDSDRWGEHRGRYWLDYARYADTHGIHFDNYREMWSYRDWVIDAFNRNLPFDRFTVEQLAGDLLPEPDLDQQIATGFNRCNITTNEGGIIDEEYKVLYARDRTETVSAVWLGLTTGCAVCHDHKFDPISMRDFYSLSAFFDNTTQPVRDGNVEDTPPIVTVPPRAERARWAELKGRTADARAAVDAARDDARRRFDSGELDITADAIRERLPNDGLETHALLGEGDGAAVEVIGAGKTESVEAPAPLSWGEGHVAPAALALAPDATLPIGEAGADWEHDRPFSYGAWVRRSRDGTGGAVMARMDTANDYRGFDLWMENDRIGAHIIHRWPDDAIKVVTERPLEKDRWHHVFITYDGSGSADGVTIFVDGEPRGDRNVSQAKLTGSIRTDVPTYIGQRSSGATPEGLRVGDVRMYDRQLPADQVTALRFASRAAYLAERSGDERSDAETDELFAWWLTTPDAAAYQQRAAELARLETEIEEIERRGTIAHVMRERDEPAEAYILARGEYDQPGERVTPAVPEALPSMPDDLPRNRLGFAQWLFQPDHPLTARVTVNRFWQEVFGTGLVATAGDFGITGEPPSHPALLDWLAVEFRESEWDVKRLFRMIVTSAAYRQSAAATPDKLAADPDNRLLSRGPRFRMDAEMVRDYALFASGLLSPTLGGPSVKPYQPEGVWEAVAMRGSNTRNYQPDGGENLYRRSMYTFWKRSAPPASMDIFNAPSREVCTVVRERTNTPLQALAALNDPQLIEAARHLAAIAIRSGSEPEVRADAIARRLLARPLRPSEWEVVRGSIQRLLEHYQANPGDAAELVAVGESPTPDDLPAAELAAYTMLANQLMNLDEVLNK